MIPRILHRSVPASTSDQVEQFWEHTGKLHPDWDLRTWRDPLNPTDFPVTAPHWHRCCSGAQLAGLVRLELLWTHGGIWLDSDVELHRNLEPFTGLTAFAGWEDNQVVPDAVLGAGPEHPAIKDCLTLALHRIQHGDDDWRTGRGSWSTGPGVTTTILPGRDDVLMLPPGTFYQVHYIDKDTADWAAVPDRAPWSYGSHRWAGSWL